MARREASRPRGATRPPAETCGQMCKRGRLDGAVDCKTIKQAHWCVMLGCDAGV